MWGFCAFESSYQTLNLSWEINFFSRAASAAAADRKMWNENSGLFYQKSRAEHWQNYIHTSLEYLKKWCVNAIFKNDLS